MNTFQHKDAKTQRHKEALTSVSLSLSVSVLIIFIAAALRFHHLGTQSLWNDEGNAYVQATRNFADIASNASRDIHPPGYYWLLALWHDLTGSSEVALRSLSTLASILSVAFTFALGKKLFNPAAGLTAATLVALNTFSIYYAQEARMYALLALWGSAGMWALVGLLKNTRTGYILSLRWGLVLALINAAGLYTQYAYPFIMLAQGVIFLLWFALSILRRVSTLGTRYSILGTYFASNVVTILLFLPWLPTALRQVTQWPSTGTPIPAGEALGIIGGWFTLGITYEFVPNAINYLPVALLLLLGGLIGWLWLRGKAVLWSTLVPILWAVLPVFLFLALGLFRPANLKFLLPAQIGFALLMGAGVGGWWALSQRGYRLDRITLILTVLQAIWLLIYLVNGLQPLYGDLHFQRADYRSMVQTITAHPREGDAIILDAPNQEEVFRYYYHGAAPVYPLPAGLGGDDAQTLATVQKIITEHQRIFVLFWGESERDPNHIVENTLDSTTYEAGQDIWYGDVRFAQYVTPVTMTDTQPIFKRFGDSILLEHAAISSRTFRPGDVIQIQLEWRTDAALTKRFKVFVQLLNSGGVLVAQRDSEPAGGSQPTTSWLPDTIITDQHGLALPTVLTAGNYQIIVGLYDADDPNQRLPVAGKTYVSLGFVGIISSES
ncbi:MAG: hypothetical protein GC179_26635 [Anaerolineaceae bacterium]|nr:hypothetical protein [Anaerolineaceae bacterium]